MSSEGRHALFIAFLGAYLLALTFPGYLPFNRIRPFVFGLPFSLAWVVFWVVLGGIAFWLLDRGERREGGD